MGNQIINKPVVKMSRRDFLKYSTAAGGTILLGLKGGNVMAKSKSQVALVNTTERKTGVTSSVKTLGLNPVKNKNVLIKPNFNTADQTPGSTHNDTLVALVEEVWNMGARSISLGERSYPETSDVMAQKGIYPLMEKLEVQIIDFDKLDSEDWVEFKPADSHWQDGFRIARPVIDAECLVMTCCLKTHQYGGIFTMSLKNSVGVVPTRRHGYGYMSELHSSPHQRKLIAEINAPFKPDLVVLDGIDAFVDGGPATGTRAQADVFLASSDRVAIDAVGVAVLKDLGSNDKIMNSRIFDQEQIARAAEIGIGASSPGEIDIIADGDQSQEYRDRIAAILEKG